MVYIYEYVTLNLVDMCAQLLETSLREWCVNYIIIVENHEDDLTIKSSVDKWIVSEVMMRYACNDVRTISYNDHRCHRYPIPTFIRHGLIKK